MGEVKKQRHMHPTDYAAIIFAVLLSPLLIMRAFSPELVQMASDMRLYSDTYYPNVKTPLMTAVLEQNIEGKQYLIPHVLFPGYSASKGESFIDAVAFTGLQKEMLYSQRFAGMRYRSPYVAHRALFTEKSKSVNSEDESLWKNTAFYFQGTTESEGRIKSLDQNPLSLNVAGVTDEYNVFLLNKNLGHIKTSDILTNKIQEIIQDNDISNFFSTKISYLNDSLFITVVGETKEKGAVLIAHKLNLVLEEKFTKTFKIDKEAWNVDESDPIINPLFISASEKQTDTPFKVLREALNATPGNIKHGQMLYSYQTDNYLVFRSKQFIVIIDKETGQEVCSFAVKFGVQLLADGDSIVLEYVSDQSMIEDNTDLKRFQKFDIVSQKLDGDNSDQLKVGLLFVTPISEESMAIESQMGFNQDKLKPTSMTLVAPVKFRNKVQQDVLVFLAPNGVLVAADATKGTKLWQTPINNFTASTLNAHINVQDTEDIQILILTIGYNIYIFNAQTGQLLGNWQIDEKVQLFDSVQNFYDDDLARVNTQVLVARLHPYVDKKAIFVVRGKFMDVVGLGSTGVALTNFWERTMLTGLVAFVLAVVFRLVITVINKKD